MLTWCQDSRTEAIQGRCSDQRRGRSSAEDWCINAVQAAPYFSTNIYTLAACTSGSSQLPPGSALGAQLVPAVFVGQAGHTPSWVLGLWDDPADKLRHPCHSQLLPVEALYFLHAGPVQQLRWRRGVHQTGPSVELPKLPSLERETPSN